MDHDVVITGRGCVTALGQNIAAFERAVFAGESGIGDISDIDSGVAFRNGAPVRGFKPEDHFGKQDLNMLDVFSQFAAVAARQAAVEAGLAGGRIKPERIAVIIGTANGGQDVLNVGYRRLFVDNARRPSPMTIPMTMASAPASRICREVGATGPAFGVTSACASSAHAIIQAMALVRSGQVDVAVTGGADSCFCFGYLRAWDATRAVSPDTCRPFSKDRKGMIIGEGAGVVVVESRRHAEARGAAPLAVLAGGGMSASAESFVASDAAGLVQAMRAALDDARLHPEDVDYINAHGTGTRANDDAEAAAILSLFGSRAKAPAVSSTKSMHGHAMGAAGAIELLATVAALRHGKIPPTINFTEPDPKCDIDVTPNACRDIAMRVAISNSFAFGGLNAALVLRRE
jgi:nodulation protein E